MRTKKTVLEQLYRIQEDLDNISDELRTHALADMMYREEMRRKSIAPNSNEAILCYNRWMKKYKLDNWCITLK